MRHQVNPDRVITISTQDLTEIRDFSMHLISQLTMISNDQQLPEIAGLFCAFGDTLKKLNSIIEAAEK